MRPYARRSVSDLNSTMHDLARVPWSTLRHAYGPATDVPNDLMDLWSDEGEKVGAALRRLFGNIRHQGTVYEATAYAVPFVVDAACRPDAPDRFMILLLLASIANGRSYLDVHLDRNECTSEQIEIARARERQFVRAAHDAVAEHYERFVAIAEEDDAWIQLSAAHVLVHLGNPPRAAAIVRNLRERVVEAANRGAYCILLGLSGDRSDETRCALLSSFASPDELERRGACLGFAHAAFPQLPEEIDAAVIAVLAEDEPAEPFGEIAPWDVTAETPLRAALAQ
jgi:hypothetical protein